MIQVDLSSRMLIFDTQPAARPVSRVDTPLSTCTSEPIGVQDCAHILVRSLICAHIDQKRQVARTHPRSNGAYELTKVVMCKSIC